MITCEHARQLFDRYLDGELSPSLQAELHAHQLSCSACQSELAMLEACGDVVLLDRCEPKLGDAFTDRVMLAHRARTSRRPQRRWGRAALLAGSPMAAAASILLAITLLMPAPQQGMVLGQKEAAPPALVEMDNALRGAADESDEAKIEFEQMQKMPAAGFVEAGIAGFVNHTQDTLEGARAGTRKFELLLRQMLADTSNKLASGANSDQPMNSTPEVDSDLPGDESEFVSPFSPFGEPADDADTDTLLDGV